MTLREIIIQEPIKTYQLLEMVFEMVRCEHKQLREEVRNKSISTTSKGKCIEFVNTPSHVMKVVGRLDVTNGKPISASLGL